MYILYFYFLIKSLFYSGPLEYIWHSLNSSYFEESGFFLNWWTFFLYSHKERLKNFSKEKKPDLLTNSFYILFQKNLTH
jgi:hypothetical protein